jgi:hypothetical protein
LQDFVNSSVLEAETSSEKVSRWLEPQGPKSIGSSRDESRLQNVSPNPFRLDSNSTFCPNHALHKDIHANLDTKVVTSAAVHRRTCPYLAEPSLKSSALIDVDSTNAAGDSCSATRKDIIKVAGLADVGPVAFQQRGITLSQTAKVDAALEQRRARIKAGLRDGSVLPTTQGSDAAQLQNQQGQGPDKGLPDRAQHRQSGAECHARAQRVVGRHADVVKSQTRTPVEIPRKAARMVSVFCCSLRATCISTCAASGLQQG